MSSSVRTESVMVQNLCVPCCCRCRYCLLSCDGRTVGIPWERSKAFARRFIEESRLTLPGLECSFSFGYSMEHPELREALRFLKSVGSPQSRFLQCDGMKNRDERECGLLADMLAEEGVTDLNFTFYGTPEYHDRFAGRKGDHELMLRMIRAAAAAGLNVTVGIPLTRENIGQTEELVTTLRESGCGRVRLFIPHEEGRGVSIAPIRLRESDLALLSDDTRGLLNASVYRAEREWIAEDRSSETRRALLVSLTPENIDRYERMSAASIVSEIEALDDAYYAAFPVFSELADRYGDPDGELMYIKRDLSYHYRRLFAKEFGVGVYDVTDERQSGSRRY